MPYLHQRLHVLADQTVAASAFLYTINLLSWKHKLKLTWPKKRSDKIFMYSNNKRSVGDDNENALKGDSNLVPGCPGSLLLLSQSLALQNIG